MANDLIRIWYGGPRGGSAIKSVVYKRITDGESECVIIHAGNLRPITIIEDARPWQFECRGDYKQEGRCIGQLEYMPITFKNKSRDCDPWDFHTQGAPGTPMSRREVASWGLHLARTQPTKKDEKMKPKTQPSINNLTGVNICFDVGKKQWRLELIAADASCWPIDYAETASRMVEKGERFSAFSNLPLTLQGTSLQDGTYNPNP